MDSVGVQAVAAILMYLFQKSLLAVIPNKDVIQMLPNVLCQQRHYNIWLHGHLVETYKIGMFHLEAMECALAGFDTFSMVDSRLSSRFHLSRISADYRNTVSIICRSAPVRNAIMAHSAQSASDWEPYSE